MLRMRLKRVGRRNRPSFRVIVTDGDKGPKTGRVVENVGFYNPITKEKDLNAERAAYWVGVGAQPSDTVHNMLVEAGVLTGKKRNALPRKSPVVKEQEEETKEEAPAEESAPEEKKEEAPAEEEKSSEEKPAEEAPKEEEKPAEEAPEEEKS